MEFDFYSAGMYIADYSLRFECHIYKIKSIRKLLNIPAKTKEMNAVTALLSHMSGNASGNIEYIKNAILDYRTNIIKNGKNYYIDYEGYKICINSSSYTVITVKK